MKIKVLIKKVGEEPEVREIESNLRTLQELVGGYIESVYFGANLDSHGIFAYGNENAKFEHQECNFWLYNKQDVFCGTAIFMKDNEMGEEVSLTDEDIELIKMSLEKSKMTESEQTYMNNLIRRNF